MDYEETQVCDVCGRPATNRAVDLLRHEVPGAARVEISEPWAPKYGCDDHPASMEVRTTHLPPSMWRA